MVENQRGSSGSGNQESKSKLSSDMREGKAKGSPSNVKGGDTDMSRKNKEGSPDELRIQGDELGGSERRSENDVDRAGREREDRGSRRNGGSI